MTLGQKYDINDRAFDSEHGVLRNKRGITEPSKLEQAESDCLIAAYETTALSISEMQRFIAADIRGLHQIFLGPLCTWAGSYRTVDLSSADIRWCHAAHIGKEMARFGARLSELTPFLTDWCRKNICRLLPVKDLELFQATIPRTAHALHGGAESHRTKHDLLSVIDAETFKILHGHLIV